MQERVAITGLGIVSAQGIGRDAFGRSLEEGVSNFVDETVMPGMTVRVGRVGEIIPGSIRLQSSKASQIDAISRYAVEACAQALKDAKIELTEELRNRTGVLLGTAYGCLESNALFDQYTRGEDGRLSGVSPLYFKSTVSNAAAGWASILLKLRGMNATFTSGELAGAEAICHAFDMLADGVTDLILAGGIDRIMPLQLVLQNPGQAVPAEGASVLALESMSAAVARGASIHGRLIGYHRMPVAGLDEAAVVRATLESLPLRPGLVGAVVSSAPTLEDAGALQAVLEQQGVSATVWPLKVLLGDSAAVWSGLALAGACLRLGKLTPAKPVVLVVSSTPDQEAICMAVRPA